MARPPKRRSRYVWSPADDMRLADLAGTMTRQEISSILTAEFRCKVSPNAISQRAYGLRVSLELNDPYWSRGAFERFFRTDWGVAIRDLAGQEALDMEWLPPGTPGARGSKGEWRVRESSIERYIRDCPWAYDPKALFPVFHPLARLARSVHQRNPWMTVSEAGVAMGYDQTTLQQWVRKGVVPHKWRRLGITGRVGRQGQVVIQAADFPQIQSEIARLRVEARRRGDEKSRAFWQQWREARAA